MRIISYDEFVFNIKKDNSYNNELLPLIEKDNSILSVLISRKVKKCSFLFFYAEHGINTLEVLFYDGYITKEDVINAFKTIKIDSTEVYERIYQYAVMYDYRRENQIFPFKMHIDTEFLKEKLRNSPEQYKVNDIKFKYNLDTFYNKDYDELMLYRRESSNMNDWKTALLEDPVACVLGQKPDRRDGYPGFTRSWLLRDYLQIFIDDELITNNYKYFYINYKHQMIDSCMCQLYSSSSISLSQICHSQIHLHTHLLLLYSVCHFHDVCYSQ